MFPFFDSFGFFGFRCILQSLLVDAPKFPRKLVPVGRSRSQRAPCDLFHKRRAKGSFPCPLFPLNKKWDACTLQTLVDQKLSDRKPGWGLKCVCILILYANHKYTGPPFRTIYLGQDISYGRLPLYHSNMVPYISFPPINLILFAAPPSPYGQIPCRNKPFGEKLHHHGHLPHHLALERAEWALAWLS